MSARSKILERLRQSSNLAVERVVGLALTENSDEGRGTPAEIQLAEVLLSRGRRSGRVALVKAFDRLGAQTRARLMAEPKELFGALSEAMQDAEGQARPNVIEIVGHSGNPRLVYLLAEALIDSRPEVRERAGDSFLGSVKHYRASCDEEADASELNARAMQVRKAVEFSLKQFRTHRQNNALLAALINERQQDSPMWSYFCDPHDDLTKAAVAILRNPPAEVGPALAGGMLLALGTSLKPAAMAGISGTEDVRLGAALLRESYRLKDPVLRDASRSIGNPKLLAKMWKECPPDDATWSHWVRMIDALGLQMADRVTWLVRLLNKAGEGTGASAATVVWKLSVMRLLAETGMPESGKVLAKMMADTDERVARVAARYMLSKKNAEWRAMAATVQTPHVSVRQMMGFGESGGRTSSLTAVVASTAAAKEIEEPTDPHFEAVWGEYSKLPPAVQGSAARASAGADPEFGVLLKGKLASEQTAEVGQGLKMVGTLTDVSPYRAQIIALCGHQDARVAAIAVKLVARLEDPRLKDLLEAAAQHADARVRANAVESMADLHVAHCSQHVLSMLNSRHNRERANAIKAISEYDFVTARECLTRMLADTNPLHRMSALWVVEQLGLPGLFRQVSAIGRRDRNARVKKRAEEMMTTLTGDAGFEG